MTTEHTSNTASRITPPNQSQSTDLKAITNKEADFFSKEMSVIVSGFAVLLMIWHHQFIFPEWLSPGVEHVTVFGEIGELFTWFFAAAGNICVQIYALMSGYALMLNTNAYSSWKKRGRRLMNFLIQYWLVCFIFLLVGSLNNDTLPDLHRLVYNMVGLATGPQIGWVNVAFAWYVAFYIEFIILSPVLIWGFSSNKKVYDVCFAISIAALVYYARKVNGPWQVEALLMYLRPLLSVSIGCMAAKYRLFDKFHYLITRRLNVVELILAVLFILFLRVELPKLYPMGGYNWYFFKQCAYAFFAGFLVLFSVEIFHRIKNHYLRRSMVALGGVSLYLWFLHGIIFTGKNFFQAQIYSLKEPLLIFILTIVIMMPVAYLLKKINGYIRI